MVTKQVRLEVQEVGCTWWAARESPSHGLGRCIEEWRKVALAVGWEGSSDGYFPLAVETSGGSRKGSDWDEGGWKMRFTFKVMISSSVWWRR